MSPSQPDRFQLRYNGTFIEVEAEPKFLDPRACLFVNGKMIEEQGSWPEATKLHAPGIEVRMHWSLLGREPQRAVAIFENEQSEENDKPKEHELIPPKGTYAARIAEFADDHPNIYASRHVLMAVAQTLIGLIGISALLWGLLPRLDLDFSWIPWPDIDIEPPDWLRDIRPPGWLRTVMNAPWLILGRLFGWLFGWVPDVTFQLDWLQPIFAYAKYWIPILIAVFVAVEEVERRNKKKEESSTDADTSGENPAITSEHADDDSALLHGHGAEAPGGERERGDHDNGDRDHDGSDGRRAIDGDPSVVQQSNEHGLRVMTDADGADAGQELGERALPDEDIKDSKEQRPLNEEAQQQEERAESENPDQG